MSLLCNEKYRNIINKLSGVIGGKHHGGLSDGNNNPAVFGDDDTVRAIKATLIDCPQKLDRTGRPKCKVSDSLANAIKNLEKSIPAGNCQVTHNEADFGYEVARPFVAGQQSSSTKSCDLQLAGHSQSASGMYSSEHGLQMLIRSIFSQSNSPIIMQDSHHTCAS